MRSRYPKQNYQEIEQGAMSYIALQTDCGSLDVVTNEQSSLPRSFTHGDKTWEPKNEKMWIFVKSLICDFWMVGSTLKIPRKLAKNFINKAEKIITQQHVRIYKIQNALNILCISFEIYWKQSYKHTSPYTKPCSVLHVGMRSMNVQTATEAS